MKKTFHRIIMSALLTVLATVAAAPQKVDTERWKTDGK